MKYQSKNILGAVVLTLTLTGCASTATNMKRSVLEAADVAFGKVTKVEDADTSHNRSYCNNVKGNADSAEVCSNLPAYNVATAAVMHSGRIFSVGVAVPKTTRIAVGNFIEFTPKKKPATLVRIVALDQTENCKWIGPTPEELNSGTAAAIGFVAGLLIVPGVVILANDEIREGGVECEGWTYKTLVGQSKALMAK